MLELGYVPLVTAVNSDHMRSALPGSPVIPEVPPGRARLLVAAALHRLASRLDRGAPAYRTRPAT
jgi:hypothetical protein